MSDANPPDGSFTPGPPRPGSAGLSLDDFVLLNEEIAGMARAGLPLDQGLAALAREMGRGNLRSVTAQLADDLKSGQTLPQALRHQAGNLPAYYANLMAAGIRTGRVGDVLSTLTVYARSMADLRSLVLGALFYPAIVLVLSVALMLTLSIGLVPQFEEIFKGFHMKLPAFTEFVIYVSNRPLEFFLAPTLALAAAVLLVRWIMRRTREGKQNWAWFLYKVPLVGTLVRAARLAAFTDLLGILVDNGQPLPEAFRLAGEASSDPLLAGGAQEVERNLAQGYPLGQALGNTTMVPEVVAWMIGLGEKRGTLGTTLHQVSEMYRRQAEMRANLLRTVLPPILIILVAGAIMLLFVLAFVLPMFQLLEGLGGGKR